MRSNVAFLNESKALALGGGDDDEEDDEPMPMLMPDDVDGRNFLRNGLRSPLLEEAELPLLLLLVVALLAELLMLLPSATAVIMPREKRPMLMSRPRLELATTSSEDDDLRMPTTSG